MQQDLISGEPDRLVTVQLIDTGGCR